MATFQVTPNCVEVVPVQGCGLDLRVCVIRQDGGSDRDAAREFLDNTFGNREGVYELLRGPNNFIIARFVNQADADLLAGRFFPGDTRCIIFTPFTADTVYEGGFDCA